MPANCFRFCTQLHHSCSPCNLRTPLTSLASMRALPVVLQIPALISSLVGASSITFVVGQQKAIMHSRITNLIALQPLQCARHSAQLINETVLKVQVSASSPDHFLHHYCSAECFKKVHKELKQCLNTHNTINDVLCFLFRMAATHSGWRRIQQTPATCPKASALSTTLQAWM